MHKFSLLAIVALLSSATAVQAQGKGGGGGRGGGEPHGHQGGGGDYGTPHQGGNGGKNRGGGDDFRVPPQGRGNSVGGAEQGASAMHGGAVHRERRPANGKDNSSRSIRSEHSGERGKSKSIQTMGPQSIRGKGRSAGDGVVDAPHGANWRNDDFRTRTIDHGRYVWHEPVFRGCPPGLAKKGNGCLPPGQARKLAAFGPGYPRWFGYSSWYRVGPAYDWRYFGGYVYRVDPATALVRSVVPLLGGALFGGNPWPQDYLVQELPPYQVRYYGYDDPVRYRFADGVVYEVDPKTQLIQSIAALMTGQRWVVGSVVPPGYSLYNVPHEYRARYVDTPASWYRYDDGYVYEIDPATQIVRRPIELLVI